MMKAKTYKLKRVVVGVLLVILTLGFCVVGTGAARPDQMGGPMGQQTDRQGSFGGRQMGGQQMGDQQMGGPGGFDGADMTPPEGEAPDGMTPPEGEAPEGQSFQDGQFSRDGGFGPGDQRDFGGRGGHGRDGGFQAMDGGVRAAIEALEDGETKTGLETLLENVHTAMEALREADDDSREAAESAVEEARAALDSALSAAGIETVTPPEKPEGDDDRTPPERPEGEDNMTPPEKPEGDNDMTPPERPEANGGQNRPEAQPLESIDLDDEEQVQNLFQRFLAWLQGSKT